MKSFDISNMGRAALSSHMKRPKQFNLARSRKSSHDSLVPSHFLKQSTPCMSPGISSTTLCAAVSQSVASHSTVESLKILLAVQHAEIRWAIKVYCEYGSELERCREWLRDNLPDLYEDLVAAVAGLEVSEDKEGKKRQTRGGKATKIAKKKASSERKVILAREQRSKKKCVTIVTGMATFDIDPKKAAKVFANKFSCGSSVTGDDEIVIQGDVAYDLLDFISEKWPEIDEDSIEDKT